MRICPLLVVVGIGVLAGSPPAEAQRTTGEITGTVTDSTGAAVPGATVTAHCEATGATRSVVTDQRGDYRLAETPVCVYRVAVSLQGFKTTSRSVQAALNNVTKADFRLEPGALTEEVTVEGVTPLVEFSDKLNNTVDTARINTLPLNGRDFNSLLGITPGVQRAPGGGFLAVNISGQRRTSNNYMLDGMPNNDRYYGDSLLNQTGVVGVPATLVPMDAIAEFTVQQTPSAEFGVKGGAAINVVMKSGTNNFHGSAHMYFADDFTNAANYFNKASGPEGCSGSACGSKTPLSNKQFGGTFGGPLVKDKTFFFGFYEGQRLRTESPYVAFVPTPDQVAAARGRIAAAGLATNPAGEALFGFYPVDPSGQVTVRIPAVADSDTFSLKLDHRFSDRNSITARYVYGRAFQSASAFTGTLAPPAPNPPDLFNSVLDPKTTAQLLGVNFTSNISNNKVFEARVNWTRFTNTITVNNKIDPKSLGLDTGPLDPEDFGVPAVYYLSYFGYIGGVGGYPITTSPTDTLDASAHLTMLKGKHSLKVGGNFQNASTGSVRNRARTIFDISGGTGDPVDSLVGLLLGRFDDASRTFGSTVRNMGQSSFGLYVNDDWKLSSRFTLSFGLRYDQSKALGEDSNLGANFLPDRGLVKLGEGIDRLYETDKNNFGPRVGFAWDIGGDGRTALRGGYALTYDIPNFGSIAAPRTTFSGLGARAGAFTQPNLGVFSVTVAGDLAVAPDDPQATCVDPATGEGNYACVGPGIAIFGPNPAGNPPFNAFSVDPQLETPSYHAFHLTLQRELFKNNVLTLSYVGSRGRSQLMYRDLNGPPIGGGPRPFANAYPELNHIIQLTNDGKSWYDSMQVSWRQSAWKGFNSQYNLTWANCRDYASINRGNRTNFPQYNNPYRPEQNKGPCDYDIRLNFNVGGTYDVPKMGTSRLGEGWQIATVFTGITGRPFTPNQSSRDRSGQGIGAIRPNCSGVIQYNPRDPNNFVANPEIFSEPAPGTVGTCGRNIGRGPGLSQWDISLLKDTRLSGNMRLQFRWEVFNVLNRANFGALTTNVRSGGFGTITSTPDVDSGNPVISQGGPRAMQFVLKLLF
jgi:hypothetical protein